MNYQIQDTTKEMAEVIFAFIYLFAFVSPANNCQDPSFKE